MGHVRLYEERMEEFWKVQRKHAEYMFVWLVAVFSPVGKALEASRISTYITCYR